MNTAVQVFMIQEAEELSAPETTEQWKALVDDLELKGQKKLMEKQDEEVISPVPYLYINTRLGNVLRTLCPRREEISAYDKMPIPLEILGHVKQAEMKQWFSSIEIWSDEKSPDPLVVGVVQKSKNEQMLYLMGRWGAENVTLDELDERAILRMMAEKKKAIIAKMEELAPYSQNETGLRSAVEKEMDGEYTGIRYIN